MQSSMKRNTSFSSMLAATAIALSGGVFSAAAANSGTYADPSTPRIVQGEKQTPNRAMPSFQELQAMRGMFSGAIRSQRYPRPGYSVKQGQRMARKVSNKARNRRAHR